MTVYSIESRYRRRDVAKEFVSEALRGHKDMIDLIMLFGSVAGKKDTPESDIDLLVVERGDRFNMRRSLSSIVSRLLLESGEYVSVKTLSNKEFERLKLMNSNFINNVLKDGQILYQRS